MSTSFRELFSVPKPLIGMVHLLPLPGSPRFDGRLSEVERRAVDDARILVDAGFDGLVVENYGDAPFLPGAVGPETVAAMAVLAERVAAAVPVPIGVNVLRNDARAALAVAAAAGGRFIRVNVHTGTTATDQGIIQGRAYETLRERARLDLSVPILADVLVKHGAAIGPADPELAAKDAVHRGLADALLVTGAATGTPAGRDRLEAVRKAVPDTPVLIASGLSTENAARLMPLADGAIVGTAVKRGAVPEAPVDPKRASALVAAFRAAR